LDSKSQICYDDSYRHFTVRAIEPTVNDIDIFSYVMLPLVKTSTSTTT